MKRANGTGSIVRLSGHRRRPYAVRISGRDDFGQIIQRTLSYHATAAEAQTALEHYNQDKARGAVPGIAAVNMTVQDAYNAWSTREYSKAGKSSIARHKAAWARVSRYASVPIRQVSIDMWQSILDEDEAKGLSQSSINSDAALIKALISYAYQRDVLAKNIYEYIEIPHVGAKYAKGSLTEAQINKLKDMSASGDKWAQCALIMCYTGFHASEFLALSLESYHKDGDYLQGGLKTQAGKNRIVPIHRIITHYVQSWISSVHPGYYVLLDAMHNTLESVGAQEATPHWCRHTFATRLYNAGIDETTRKWLLGHATTDITERYTHAGLAQLRAAIDQLT